MASADRKLASFVIFKQSHQMGEHNVVLSIVTVAGLGVGAQWLAWRLKMPAIVLLAAVGLIMGPGLDLIHPSQDFGEFLRPVVSLCVAIILFEGGLSLQLRELKEAGLSQRRGCRTTTAMRTSVGTSRPMRWRF